MLKPTPDSDDSTGWGGVRILFGSPSKFVDTLKEYGDKRIKYLRENTVNKILKKIENQSEIFDKVEEASQSAAALFMWVQATLNFY
jgi:hypothetical protein